jgi:hypothetical protein
MATVVNIRPSQSSEIIESAFQSIPGIIGQVRQSQMDTKRLEMQQSAALREEAEFNYLQKKRKKDKDAKQALYSTTAGLNYNWEALANPETYNQAFASSLPDNGSSWEAYQKAQILAGNTPELEAWEMGKKKSDMHYLNKEIGIFNELKEAKRLEGLRKGVNYSDESLDKYMQQQYNADNVYAKARQLYGEMPPQGATALNYTPRAKDLGFSGNLAQMASELWSSPEITDEEGNVISGGKAGAGQNVIKTVGLPLGAYLGYKGLKNPKAVWEATKGLFGMGSKDAVKKAVSSSKAVVPQGMKSMGDETLNYVANTILKKHQQNPEVAAKWYKKLVKSYPGLKDVFPGGGPGKMSTQQIMAKIKELSGSAPKNTSNLPNWKEMTKGPGFLKSLGIYSAPAFLGGAGSILGDDEGELLGKTAGTGLMAKYLGGPGASNIASWASSKSGKVDSFMKFAAKKFPKILGKAGVMAMADSPALPFGDMLALGFTAKEVVGLYKDYQEYLNKNQ